MMHTNHTNKPLLKLLQVIKIIPCKEKIFNNYFPVNVTLLRTTFQHTTLFFSLYNTKLPDDCVTHMKLEVAI